MINIIKWYKEWRTKNCKHSKVVIGFRGVPKRKKFKGRYITKYDVYQVISCNKCGKPLGNHIIERDCSANTIVSKYNLKP